jgi:hypothetical protein
MHVVSYRGLVRADEREGRGGHGLGYGARAGQCRGAGGRHRGRVGRHLTIIGGPGEEGEGLVVPLVEVWARHRMRFRRLGLAWRES